MMDMAAMLTREITLESDAARKVRSHASDDRTDFLNEGKEKPFICCENIFLVFELIGRLSSSEEIRLSSQSSIIRHVGKQMS